MARARKKFERELVVQGKSFIISFEKPDVFQMHSPSLFDRSSIVNSLMPQLPPACDDPSPWAVGLFASSGKAPKAFLCIKLQHCFRPCLLTTNLVLHNYATLFAPAPVPGREMLLALFLWRRGEIWDEIYRKLDTSPKMSIVLTYKMHGHKSVIVYLSLIR